jgi:N-acetylmuramoyl-L-alanine amidase
MKFCIDFGHGGSDPGAIGPTGFTEAEAVKSIGKHVGRGLSEANHEVVYSRLNDVFVELEDRAKFANDENVDFFLSIHANAHETIGAQGFEIWTSPGQTGADPIATRIYESALASFQSIRGRPDFSDGDPDREAKFLVLTQTRMPAALVEVCFISNPTEEKWIRDPGWRLRMGGAIVSGLWRN